MSTVTDPTRPRREALQAIPSGCRLETVDPLLTRDEAEQQVIAAALMVYYRRKHHRALGKSLDVTITRVHAAWLDYQQALVELEEAVATLQGLQS